MLRQVHDFASRLERVMAGCNLSRMALARELGVDKSVVSRWLNGVNRPTGENLARLTEVLRRHRPDLTLPFWREPGIDTTPAPASDAGLSVTGLTLPARADIDGNYEGLWAGFYQSTQNRGSAILCAMHIFMASNGLRATFTEGRVVAAGAAVAIGARLHLILEITPLHDRLCLFVMNGVGSPETVGMEGIYMTSAGESEICASAAPIILLRIGDRDDVARAGGVAGLMQKILPINVRNVTTSVATKDAAAGLAGLVPESVLRLVCVNVGTQRPDGETDFVMRMPKHRSPPHLRFSAEELPPDSPIRETWRGLRRVFGIGEGD